MDNFGALVILFVFIIGISILGAIPGLKDRKMSAENWAVGGRNFGRWLNWFIMCGEVYTAFAFLGASGWAYARVAVAVCLAVAAGGTVGGTVIYRTQQTKKNRVDVMPGANLTQYWWGDDLSMDGQVISGDVQNVTPSDDQMIAKVLVKQGDFSIERLR